MLRVLGSVRADGAAGPVEIRGEQLKTIVGYFVVNASRPVDSVTLVHLLWPNGATDTAQSAVRNLCTRFRRVLAEAAPSCELTTDQRTGSTIYRFTAHNLDVDSLRFASLVAQSEEFRAQGSHTSAVAPLREALNLWSGLAFEDIDNPELAAAAAALESQRISAIEQLGSTYVHLGRNDAATTLLEPVAVANRGRERLASLLMRAYYRSGRAIDALATYTATRTHLGEELGLEPGRELVELERAIITHAHTHSDPETPTIQVPRRGPFVGRAIVSEELLRHLQGPQSGDVAIIGEGGSGKSRLAAELAVKLQESAAVAYVRCEGTNDAPLAVIRRVLLALPFEDSTSALASVDELIGDLIGPDVGETGALPGLIDIAKSIDNLLRSAPLTIFIVVDDAHLCDEPTMRVLRAWMRQRRSDVYFIFLSRPNPEASLARVVADPSQLPDLLMATLSPLTESDLTSWVRSSIGERVHLSPQTVAREIRRATGGLPFYCEHLMRELAQGDADAASVLRTLRTLGSPSQLSYSLSARIQRLEPSVRRSLAVGSLLGNEFKAQQAINFANKTFGSSHSPIRDNDVDGLARSSDFEPDVFTFSHDLVRSALVETLAPDDRRSIHHLGLQSLAVEPETVARRANHAASSVPLTNIGAAVSLLEEAADQAYPLSGFSDTVALLDRAIALVESTAGADSDHLLKLRIKRARAIQHLGARNQSLTEHATALDDAIAAGRHDLAAESALAAADFGEILDDADPVRKLLESALAAQPESSEWRAPLAAELTIKCTIIDGATAEVLSLHRSELGGSDAYQQERDRSLLHIMAGAPDPAARLEVAQSLRSRNVHPTSRASLDAVLFEISALLELGRTSDAQRLLSNYQALAQRANRPGVIWLAQVAASDIAQATGHLAEAARISSDALQYGIDHHIPDAPASFAGHALLTSFISGTLHTVQLDVSSHETPIPVTAAAVAALVDAHQGRMDTAKAAAAAVIDELVDAASWTLMPFTTMAIAEACIALGDAALARRVEDLLAPFRQTMPRMALVGTSFGPSDRQLGLLALLRHDIEEAQSCLTSAIEFCRDAGLPLWEARCRVDLLVSVKDSGTSGLREMLNRITVELPQSLGEAAAELLSERQGQQR